MSLSIEINKYAKEMIKCFEDDFVFCKNEYPNFVPVLFWSGKISEFIGYLELSPICNISGIVAILAKLKIKYDDEILKKHAK